MSSQVLIIVGALVLLALAVAVAVLFNPPRRAARRARILEEAEQAERLRHDPSSTTDPHAVRWEAKRTDTIHNFPGGIGGGL